MPITHVAVHRTIATLAGFNCHRAQELLDRLPDSDVCNPYRTGAAYSEWATEARRLLERFAIDLDAALDLLESLDALMASLDDLPEGTLENFEDRRNAWKRAKAAIAKATGKEVARAMPDVRS